MDQEPRPGTPSEESAQEDLSATPQVPSARQIADNPLRRAISIRPSLGWRYPNLMGVGDWEQVFEVVDAYVERQLVRLAQAADTPLAAVPPSPDLEQDLERLAGELLPGVVAEVVDHGLDGVRAGLEPTLDALTRRSLMHRFELDVILPVAWARQVGFEPERPKPDDVLVVSDFEIGIAVAKRGGRFVVERISRGVRTTQASFASLESAYKFMLVDLGPYVRPRLGLRALDTDPPRLDTPDDEVIRVGDGEFPASLTGRLDAARFAQVADAKPGTIAASFRSRDGRPLFNR